MYKTFVHFIASLQVRCEPARNFCFNFLCTFLTREKMNENEEFAKRNKNHNCLIFSVNCKIKVKVKDKKWIKFIKIYIDIFVAGTKNTENNY